MIPTDTDSVRSMHPGKSSSDRSGHPDCFLKMVLNNTLHLGEFVNYI
jgi:hypothetical protein